MPRPWPGAGGVHPEHFHAQHPTAATRHLHATVAPIHYHGAMTTAPPTCHEPYDLTGIDWAEQAPSQDTAAAFLGAFGNCSLLCQDQQRDATAADNAATTLVALALISTSIALQGDRALTLLIDNTPTVPPMARTVFATVIANDLSGGRDAVTAALADASVEQRSELIEWWANMAIIPPGALRGLISAGGLG